MLVARGRESVANALEQVTARTLVVGLKSDVLFPLSEQWEIVEGITNAELQVIDSNFGHDGFLIETKKLTSLIADFLGVNSLKKKQLETIQITN